MKKAALKFLLPVCVLFLLLFYLNNRSKPLDIPEDIEVEFPAGNPPETMKIYHISTGINHRTAAFAYRGGSFFDKRDFAMSAVLVKHPKGNLLIDTGFGNKIKKHFQSMPLYFRMTTDFQPGTSAAAQLKAKDYPLDSIRSILLTHAHWDHVSGIPDFGKTPVLVTQDELNYIQSKEKLSELARSFQHANYQTYSFSNTPYLNFSSSYDLYGDGSVVIVPSAGHTPGSVIVFLHLPSGERYALIGDLAWQLEGITQLEERPWLQSFLADSDQKAVQENLKKLYALHKRFPDLHIVPAHDSRAFGKIPKWE